MLGARAKNRETIEVWFLTKEEHECRFNGEQLSMALFVVYLCQPCHLVLT